MGVENEVTLQDVDLTFNNSAR